MTKAEDWKVDLSQFVAVTMTTPYRDRRQPGSLSLQCYEIANACLIHSSSIVDHQNIAFPRIVDCLEEDIYAAIMAGRHCLARDDPASGDHSGPFGSNARIDS